MLTPSVKSTLIKCVGLIFCTVPVIICVLLYFPLWKAKGSGAVLSGFALLLILLSLVPMFKTVKRFLSSPAAHTMWFIAFISFFILSNIADEMTVISFVGFIGNLIGAMFFKLAEKNKKETAHEGQL